MLSTAASRRGPWLSRCSFYWTHGDVVGVCEPCSLALAVAIPESVEGHAYRATFDKPTVQFSGNILCCSGQTCATAAKRTLLAGPEPDMSLKQPIMESSVALKVLLPTVIRGSFTQSTRLLYPINPAPLPNQLGSFTQSIVEITAGYPERHLRIPGHTYNYVLRFS